MNSSVQGDTRKRRLPAWLIPLLGWGVSIASLVWVYHGFDWATELPKLAATDWRWVMVAVVGDVLVYACQGWRWNLLLRPLARMPVIKTIQAVYIGLFANEILPFRTGEVIRCYLVSRWTSLGFPVTVTSGIIERLWDGIWLFLGFYACTFFIELPGILVQGSRIMAVVLTVLALLSGLAIYWKHHAHAAVRRSRWAESLWHVVEGLHAMGRSRTFYLAGLVSLLYLALQVVPIYALMQGFGLTQLGMAQAAVLLVILRLGSIPPQAPGNVGAFQALTKLGLLLFGIDSATATGFATLLFFVVTLPLWAAGLVALAATGMKLGDIRRFAQGHHERPAGAPPPSAHASPAADV